MTTSPATKRRKRPGSATRSRRGRPTGQASRRGLVVVLLGAALLLGLTLASYPPPPETDEGRQLQAVWSDPIPSFLTAALTGPSSCSGRDFGIALASGTATVRFCRTLTSGGVGQDARMRAQIETTLRQFPTIRAVRLLGRSGHCLFDESGQDRCLANARPVAPQANRPVGGR